MKCFHITSLSQRLSAVAVLTLTLLLCLAGCGSDDSGQSYPSSQAGPAPTSPGGFVAADFYVTPVPPEIRDRYQIDTAYYTKYTSIWGIPITAGPEVEDIYLKNTAEMIGLMLSDVSLSEGNGQKIRDLLFQNMLRVAIYPTGKGVGTQQLPEFRGFGDATGYGATKEIPVIGFGELSVGECFEGGDYAQGRLKQGNTLVHEMMHSIHLFAGEALQPGFNANLQRAYANAVDQSLWDSSWYIIDTNEKEYLAEGAEIWFNWFPYAIDTGDDLIYASQDDLRLIDPQLYEMLSVFFRPGQDVMDTITFCAPKVTFHIDLPFYPQDMGSYCGLVSLYGDGQYIKKIPFYTRYSEVTLHFPDPSVSYIRYSSYMIQTTVNFDSETIPDKVYTTTFSAEDLIAEPGFPNIYLRIDP